MAYSTLTDLKLQLPETIVIELTDDANAGTVDEDVVTRAIEDADDEIDAYCRKSYTVPFTTVPNIIRKLSVDITIYNLYARRRSVPEAVETRYGDAIELLTRIKTGEVELADTGIGPESHAIDIEPQFTRGKFDYDDELVENVMGKANEEEGSLDDW